MRIDFSEWCFLPDSSCSFCWSAQRTHRQDEWNCIIGQRLPSARGCSDSHTNTLEEKIIVTGAEIRSVQESRGHRTTTMSMAPWGLSRDIYLYRPFSIVQWMRGTCSQNWAKRNSYPTIHIKCSIRRSLASAYFSQKYYWKTWHTIRMSQDYWNRLKCALTTSDNLKYFYHY